MIELTSYPKDQDVVAIWMFEEGKGDVAKDMTENGHDGNYNLIPTVVEF